ncbi:phosphatase PAP2 family protein [Phytomonospora sp. NPDC050363]|uniref:phosphatase PAP2 family protein n=1 Tax=Phytomonospora sp. NPDC050363 TaxID=3155642 RepID=UPI0033FECBEE
MTTYVPQPHRRTWAATAALALGALLCASAAVMTYVVAVQTYTGQALENQGLNITTETVPHPSALALLGLVGSPPLIIGALAAILLIGVLTRDHTGGRRRVRYGVAGTAVAALSIATTELLKQTLPRPDLDVYGSGSPLHNSFPSGHTTVAASVAFGLILAAPPFWRGILAAPALLAIGLVAASTIVTGWHRVSDTVGATLIAATYLLLAATLMRLPKPPAPTTPHLPAAPTPPTTHPATGPHATHPPATEHPTQHHRTPAPIWARPGTTSAGTTSTGTTVATHPGR